ncbi:MAG: SusD/RagB family nutrient-binding outer membrane lipoprotein, partial [Bacteroidota bacterium]
MKNYIKLLALIGLFSFSACESLVDDINDNPNDILIDDVQADLFLTGAMLANVSAQVGHANRIAAMYSGQLVGITSLYSNIYGFSLSTVESNATWSRVYVGMIPNLRTIRENVPNDALLNGICKVLEAHGVSTAASLFGNIPYSEVNDPKIEDPVFDSQTDVYEAVVNLLDDAINDLAGATSRPLSVDIHFGGNAAQWLEVANTLKARCLLQQKDYAGALTAAQNGISSDDNSMRFIPRGSETVSEGDKNLFWQILEGSRAGDIGTVNSYMIQLIDPANADSRNNSKTDETARLGYYSIDESGGS